MVVPQLLQEIVDKIIYMLLCSLISKGWTYRSSRHLFENVELRSFSDLQLWSRTRTSSERSSHHLRSLCLVQDWQKKWMSPYTLAAIQTDFKNVESLTSTGSDLTIFDERSLTRVFSNFSEHLTSLSIKSPIHNSKAFRPFVPHPDNIELKGFGMVKASLFPPSSSPATTVLSTTGAPASTIRTDYNRYDRLNHGSVCCIVKFDTTALDESATSSHTRARSSLPRRSNYHFLLSSSTVFATLVF